jgi:oligopeptide transport system ATP-binding protein
MTEETLFRVEHLSKHYPLQRGLIIRKHVGIRIAVDDVSFAVRQGETLALVGESGSGKSTLSRLLLGLMEPTDGRALFRGENIFDLSGKQLREARKHLQIVFQDPVGSFDPMHKVGYSVAYPMRVLGWGDAASRRERVAELLELVGLHPRHADRYPHQFSGGQRQRLGIARALAVEPMFIVLDEPVSALDVSIQAQMLNLINDLQARLGLTYLLVANNLNVVYHIAHRVAVMYQGSIVEIGPTQQVFTSPRHPYTRALLASILGMHGRVPAVRMQEARAVAHRAIVSKDFVGCKYRWECPLAAEVCEREAPPLRPVDRSPQLSACHFAEQVPEIGDAAAAPTPPNGVSVSR